MAEDTANERIRDAFILHQVGLQFASQAEADELVRILDRTERDIRDEVRRALDGGATISTSRGLRRLQNMEDQIARIREAALGKVEEQFSRSAGRMARHEAEFAATTIDAEMPVVLDLQMPDPSTLLAIASESAFEGALLSDWMDRLREADRQRIVDAVRVGMTRGLSNQDIVSNITGIGGVTQVTRNQLTSLVRTAVNAYSNQARSMLFEENKDVLDREQYVATLDARTTQRCRSLDGKIFLVGRGPHPPQHFGCRSLRIAFFGELAAERPMNASTERQLVREYSEAKGLGSLRRRDQLPRGTRGDFDRWARGRVRELIGRAPAHLTYEQFLRRQSPEFVEEVLGKARAKLFIDGGLTLGRFSTRSGNTITLDKLVQRERDAFLKAGLDPDRF